MCCQCEEIAEFKKHHGIDESASDSDVEPPPAPAPHPVPGPVPAPCPAPGPAPAPRLQDLVAGHPVPACIRMDGHGDVFDYGGSAPRPLGRIFAPMGNSIRATCKLHTINSKSQCYIWVTPGKSVARRDAAKQLICHWYGIGVKYPTMTRGSHISEGQRINAQLKTAAS